MDNDIHEEYRRAIEQRDRYAQLAVDLANVVREVDPVALGIEDDVWDPAERALKQVDLGLGIGGRYEWPR